MRRQSCITFAAFVVPLDFRSFVADLKRRAGDIHGGTCNATVKHPLTTGTWMGSCNVTSRSPRGTQRRCHRNRLTFRKLGSSGIQKGLRFRSSGVFAVGLPQTEVFYRVTLVVKILSASRLSVIFISQRHLSRFSVIFYHYIVFFKPRDGLSFSFVTTIGGWSTRQVPRWSWTIFGKRT